MAINEYALTSPACASPSLDVFIKSFLKSSVFACAIACKIPSIFPCSFKIISKHSFIESSLDTLHAYAFAPGISSINFFTLLSLSVELYVILASL